VGATRKQSIYRHDPSLVHPTPHPTVWAARAPREKRGHTEMQRAQSRGPREERGNVEMQDAQRGHRRPCWVAKINIQPEDDRQHGRRGSTHQWQKSKPACNEHTRVLDIDCTAEPNVDTPQNSGKTRRRKNLNKH
jgi:hypothetical protein